MAKTERRDRLQVNFRCTEDFLAILDGMEGQLMCLTRAEVLRRSTLFFRRVLREIDEGGKFVLVDSDGEEHPVIIA